MFSRRNAKPVTLSTDEPDVSNVSSSQVDPKAKSPDQPPTSSSKVASRETDDIEKDATFALVLQMENADNTYATLFFIDDSNDLCNVPEGLDPEHNILTKLMKQAKKPTL